VTVRTPVYVALALGLILFGVLGMFSIGAPFFFTGVAMLAVLPWRGSRGVLVPAIVAPWAFTIGYVLVAPLWCTGTNAPTGLGDTTTCTNVLGIDYSGGGAYRAPLMPAVAAGLGLAAIALVGLRAAIRRRP